MDFSLRYDLRAPAFGPAQADLFAACLDQCEWADKLGFESVALTEHHGSEDGYNPSPLTLAAAVAA
ncbi:MAG: LLM class flavin-dependent oxidoreductase, partial [Acidimicrobiaceae bacterium]|nr:LLM class flavin-dependent oxidoreductase [Acidimicrobiaceae bacterium]